MAIIMRPLCAFTILVLLGVGCCSAREGLGEDSDFESITTIGRKLKQGGSGAVAGAAVAYFYKNIQALQLVGNGTCMMLCCNKKLAPDLQKTIQRMSKKLKERVGADPTLDLAFAVKGCYPDLEICPLPDETYSVGSINSKGETGGGTLTIKGASLPVCCKIVDPAKDGKVNLAVACEEIAPY